MATVQVLVPCYNYGMYLEACVRSVLDQERVDVDVLVIDDCSSDDTPRVAARLEQADRRVRFIRHESNRGHIATYNEGIAQIRGDYFVLLSADDLLTPGSLARATDLMEANPSVGMVYGQPISLYGTIPPEPRTDATGWSVWPGREWARLVCEAGKNFVVSPEAVVRTRIQERIGGYNAELPHSADMELWLKIAGIADIGRVKGADQAYYRVHASSMQRTVHRGYLFDLEGRRDAFRSAFEKEAGNLDDAGILHATAKRSLAAIAIRHARRECAGGDPDIGLVDRYRSFALDLDPAIASSGAWRALKRARAGRGRTLARLSAGMRQLIEKQFFDRLEYYRARRTGIYLQRY